jgi:TrmH family RNA methyltransferase
VIRSRTNPTIRRLRRLKRERGAAAVLEGPDLIAEAAAAGVAVELVLATPDFLAGAAARRLQEALAVTPLTVSPALMGELADADSPRGALALAELPRSGIEGLTAADGAYLYLDGVQQPANLGALARVAEAAGARALALAPGSVHPNHPRALRASAGSLLRLPVAVGVTPRAAAAHLAAVRPCWVALDPHDGVDLWQAELPPNLVLALGAEGPGLSAEAAALADLRLRVTMEAPVESLNVTVAAALVLFELRRRRAAAAGRAGQR